MSGARWPLAGPQLELDKKGSEAPDILGRGVQVRQPGLPAVNPRDLGGVPAEGVLAGHTPVEVAPPTGARWMVILAA